jgi:HK97 family phage major capsid protein
MPRRRNTEHLTLLGYRKNGAPIYLARGGAPRHRPSATVQADIEIQRGIVLEVHGMETPAETDLTRQDVALDLIPTLEQELTRSAEYEDEIIRLQELADDPENVEPGDQRDTPAIERRRERGTPALVVKGDEFEILRSSSRHMGDKEWRDGLADNILRASERYEYPDGYTDSLPKFVKRHKRDSSWSKNILGRMDPNYISAFEKITMGDHVGITLTEVERSAIAVGTNTAGGYLVPTHLDPTLVLTNNGVSNVIRGLARTVTLTGGANKWNGVTTAGATASWDAELTEVSDDTPPVAPAQVPVYSAKALIMASIESFEDITGLASDVQMMLADAKDRLEAAAHATGSGSGQPTGIFTALAGTGSQIIGAGSAAAIALADLQKTRRQLPVRWRGRGTWLMNPTFLGYIQALGTALSASYSTDLTQPYTDRIIGRPVVESDEAPAVEQTTTNDAITVFGDFSNFLIVDKPGSTSIEFIPHLFNTSNNLPDGRRGWYMHFRNGADSINDAAFRLLVDKTTA